MRSEKRLHIDGFINRYNIIFGLLMVITTMATGQESGLIEKEYPIQGTPGIVHYNRKDFKSDPQFWTVTEDDNGILYFGNNDGAVIYDGEKWHQVSLPNKSSIRSLATDSLGNVYAGGFDEFGLIKKDNTGQYYYKSLIDSLKFNDPTIANLWAVHIVNGTVIYRSFSQLILINGNKVTALPSASFFVRSFLIGDDFYVQDQTEGIFKLDLAEKKLEPYFSNEDLEGEEIISMLPIEGSGDQVLGVGKSGKLLQIDLATKTTNLITDLFTDPGIDQIETAVKAKNGMFYLGTLGHGIIMIDGDGNVIDGGKNFQNLQDMSVLGLFESKQGNIWALLNNGLDCITITSPVTTIFEGASLYDVLVRDNEIYLATNQGVFFSDELGQMKPNFEKLKGMEGQAWTFQVIKGDILVGHNKGLYKINKTNHTKIGHMNGIWKVIPINENKDQFLAASYSGLHVVTKDKSGNWKVLRKIEGFDESARDIMESDKPGTFWVCHGYKGVFRIKIDEDYTKLISFEHFTTQNGLNFPYNVNVFKWKGQTVFTTNDGLYTYDLAQNEFKPYAPLNKILDPTKNTRTLFQDLDKTWFVQDDEAGYFLTDSPNPQLETGYFLQFKGDFNRGMECIMPLSKDKVLIGTKTGLYLFDLNYRNDDKMTSTIISGARYISEDEGEKWLPLSNDDQLSLQNNTSSLRFDFTAPEMQKGVEVQYAFKLENADKNWSEWQSTSSKDYAHLRPGSYEFKVKSRSMLGTQGEMASLRFQILPLWYQTKWAVLSYILVAVVLIAVFIRIVKRKIDHENTKALEEQHKAKKLLELELAQLKLQAERDKISKDKMLLQEDVIYKSKELANYTMMLVKKKEVFAEISEDIKEVRRLVRNEISRRKLQKIFSKLNQHSIGEEYIHVFETNFEKVHEHFFHNLKNLYPDLTQRELRLCAFIKMNLTNKEISPLLNISVRGVETARYRVRKKMNLEHEHNFTEFLENVASETVES